MKFIYIFNIITKQNNPQSIYTLKMSRNLNLNDQTIRIELEHEQKKYQDWIKHLFLSCRLMCLVSNQLIHSLLMILLAMLVQISLN